VQILVTLEYCSLSCDITMYLVVKLRQLQVIISILLYNGPQYCVSHEFFIWQGHSRIDLSNVDANTVALKSVMGK